MIRLAITSVVDISEESAAGLRRIRSQFPTPEDIDDGSETAPSKRIARTTSMYRKALHGPLIAETIGLDVGGCVEARIFGEQPL